MLEQILGKLYPREQSQTPGTEEDAEESEPITPITPAELKAAIKKMTEKNTAPGPDGIPGKAVYLAMTALGENLLNIFNNCVREGKMPEWKRAKLVMIPKPGKDLSTPAAYRPICLISEAGKLLERVIAERIKQHLKTVGPDIHEQQYGFRQGKSTIDAIDRVQRIAREAVKERVVALAMSVDITNAFNTLPWRAIENGLAKLGLPSGIRKIVSNYLKGRTIEYKGEKGITRRTVDRGVPQGSVLGPLLWNIGYNTILSTTLPAGVHLTCYADDKKFTETNRCITKRRQKYKEK